MEFRQLGIRGLRVSAIGLGAVAFGDGADAAEARRIIRGALELGVTFRQRETLRGMTLSPYPCTRSAAEPKRA